MEDGHKDLSLTLDTVLHRTSDIRVEIDSSNEMTVTKSGMKFRVGSRALGVLHTCLSPTPIREILASQCQGLGEREVKETIKTIHSLVFAGVLSTRKPHLMSESIFPFGGYASPYVQIKMLNDINRKRSFLTAIRQEISPDDIVLDLGTGSGIMAIAAAQAGAKKVYAVEPSGIINIAEENAKNNGVYEKIEFIRGWSTSISLSDKATILITDLIGNDPFDLEMWEIIQDARSRLLEDNFRCFPETITLYARLVNVPEEVIREHIVTNDLAEGWRQQYGIDFSAFVDANGDGLRGWFEKPRKVSQWAMSAKTSLLGEVDLTTDVAPLELDCVLESEGEQWNGVVVFYSAKIGRTFFSSDPRCSQDYSHWFSAVWIIPSQIGKANRIQIVYRYVGEGESVLEAYPCS